MPALFSNDMEYWNPEQPPPTTPTRNPVGTGVCCAMISFTLEMAFDVRLIGGAFLGLVSTFGSVVVDISRCSPWLLRIIAELISGLLCTKVHNPFPLS